MTNYIEKNILVAEINRLIKSPMLYKSENVETRISVLEHLLSFLDTLEVKEVDLEKEVNEAWNYIFSYGWDENSRMALKHDEYMEFAKHFFELGLNTQKRK